jgi:hypothetical protein
VSTDQPRPRDEADDRRRRRAPAAGGRIAVVGLVLGVLALVTGCLTGIPAIICSGIGMNRASRRGVALAGMLLGCAGTFLVCPLLVARLAPEVQRVREAAGRARDSSSLHQIVIAHHWHHDAKGALPPADGTLSWRVHLLPYLEQQPLYQQFNPNEPWDGPANRPSADVRVPQYVSALDGPDATDTRFRVFTGPGTIFEPGRPPLTLAEITDGTGNTVLVAEAAAAVRWPQPRELAYSPGQTLPDLGHPRRTVVLLLMADGTVRGVRRHVGEQTLRALITPAGGETLPAGWEQ